MCGFPSDISMWCDLNGIICNFILHVSVIDFVFSRTITTEETATGIAFVVFVCFNEL